MMKLLTVGFVLFCLCQRTLRWQGAMLGFFALLLAWGHQFSVVGLAGWILVWALLMALYKEP